MQVSRVKNHVFGFCYNLKKHSNKNNQNLQHPDLTDAQKDK